MRELCRSVIGHVGLLFISKCLLTRKETIISTQKGVGAWIDGRTQGWGLSERWEDHLSYIWWSGAGRPGCRAFHDLPSMTGIRDVGRVGHTHTQRPTPTAFTHFWHNTTSKIITFRQTLDITWKMSQCQRLFSQRSTSEEPGPGWGWFKVWAAVELAWHHQWRSWPPLHLFQMSCTLII